MKLLHVSQCFSNFNHKFSTSKSIFRKIYDTNEIMLQWRQVWIVDRSIISSISYCVLLQESILTRKRLKAYPIYTIDEKEKKAIKNFNDCSKTGAHKVAKNRAGMKVNEKTQWLVVLVHHFLQIMVILFEFWKIWVIWSWCCFAKMKWQVLS